MSGAAVAQHVAALLQRRHPEMIELLHTLVAAESPSLVPESQHRVLDLLADRLAELSFRSRRPAGRSSGGMLYARPDRRDPGQGFQLLIGHCDTVWPLGSVRDQPPGLKGDRWYGPGSYDMKAGLVQGIFALDALRRLGVEPALLPVMLVNSDEEIGSADSTALITRLARRACRTFVLEPSLGPAGALKTGRKGVGRFTVTITGVAAHAGLDPDRGVSAILELSHVIQTVFGLNDPERGTTVNVGTIDGGSRPNVVAARSQAVIDVRVADEEEADRVETAIRSLRSTVPGTRLDIEGRIGRPPMPPNPDNLALFEAARRIGSALGLELEGATAGGGSDGNTTSRLTPTLDGLGAVGDGAHAVGEHVVVPAMPLRAALLAGLLVEPATGEVG